MMLFKPSPTRGFTLIECMFAVAILAIVGIGMISTVNMTRTMAELDKQRISAVAAARNFLEERARHDLYPTLTPIADVTLDNFNTPDTTDDLRATMTVEIFAVNPDGSRGAQLLGAPATDDRVEVVITVSWNRTGRLSSHRMSESLSTYVAPDL